MRYCLKFQKISGTQEARREHRKGDVEGKKKGKQVLEEMSLLKINPLIIFFCKLGGDRCPPPSETRGTLGQMMGVCYFLTPRAQATTDHSLGQARSAVNKHRAVF